MRKKIFRQVDSSFALPVSASVKKSFVKTFVIWCAPGSISGAPRRSRKRRRWSIKISIWSNDCLRDQLSDDFESIRVDSEEEYQAIVEFVNRIQPRLVKRVKLYTKDQPILEAYGVQVEIDKAIKPRVWLKSGGYLVINQTEALVAIDVNTGKFVGRGSGRLEDTITRTNLEAVDEIVRQIRLRDLGGIIVLDLIDMEERRNRHEGHAVASGCVAKRQVADQGAFIQRLWAGDHDAQACEAVAGENALFAVPVLPGRGPDQIAANDLLRVAGGSAAIGEEL